MASLSPAETASPQVAADRWTAYSVTVWAICMLGFAFDIYEGTIMQLATPLLIKEWGIAPATIGNITTVSRWVGLIGVFVFPTLADLYGRRPILVLTILGYSLLTGLTGFAQGPMQLLIFTSITRITLQGETPVGMILRNLRLLPLRLALRPLWPPLRHTRLRSPGFDSPHRFGISRRSVEPVLGGVGLEFL